MTQSAIIGLGALMILLGYTLRTSSLRFPLGLIGLICFGAAAVFHGANHLGILDVMAGCAVGFLWGVDWRE